MGVVGVDEQRAVVAGKLVDVDVILDPGLARADKDRFGQRIGGGDKADFAGFVVGCADNQPLLVGRKRAADTKALVVLVQQLDVVGQRLAQPVKPGVVRPPLLVG